MIRRPRIGRTALVAAFAVALVVALFGPVGGATTAVAQTGDNDLVSSDPADGATLGTSPEQMTFRFAQSLADDDAFTAPVSCGNEAQPTGIPEVSGDGDEVVVDLPRPLPRGACTVSWALRDGLSETIASGLITFSVQSSAAPDDDEGAETTSVPAPVAPTPTAADEPEGSTGGALWLGRFVSTLAVLGLFGALVLIGMAWPEGPEYVITIRFLRSLWTLALVGTFVFVAASTAEASDRAFGASLNPTTWLDLLDEGWSGRAALVRLVLVVALGWVAMRPEKVIDPTTQIVAYALPALAVVAVGFSRVDGNLALVGAGLGVVHALAAAVWFGGALLVARVVVAGPGDDDLVHAVRGFQRVSTAAIVVTVGTGLLQTFRIVGGALFSSSHGRVLLLKTLAVAVMLFVAVATRQQIAARLRRADQMTAPNADRFRRAFSTEAGVGVIVLALSAWLLALVPAGIDDRPAYAVERQFTDPTSGLDVTVFVTPSAVGLNGIRVEVNAPAEGITNLSVAFLPPEGSGARGIEQPIPLTGAGTAVLDTEDGLPFDVGGAWTMQLTGVTPGGMLTGATTGFPVGGPTTITDGSDGTDANDGTDGSTEPVDDGDGGVDDPVVSIEIIELDD